MTKPMEATSADVEPAAVAVRRPRKATVWTKDKITHLITLYRSAECLWNYKKEAYKSKVTRSKAIDDICAALSITKFDFGKKIHNLRNQFNSEMKKLERRIEEAGGNPALELNTCAGGIGAGGVQRCRWEHFESLMFLRNVIEPRPGGYQTPSSGAASNGFPQPKKLCLKFDYNSEDDVSERPQQHATAAPVSAATIGAEDVTEYHFEEAALEEEDINTDDFQTYDEAEEEAPPSSPSAERRQQEEETYDQKYKPPMSGATAAIAAVSAPTPEIAIVTTSPTKRAYFTRVHQQQQLKPQQHYQLQTQQQQELLHLNGTHRHLPMGSVIELPAAVGSIPASNTCTDAAASASTEHKISNQKLQRECSFESPRDRDQWDAFGELIASELRHLNTNASRKKLKRKFMQAMLEVGEEDDAYASASPAATN